MALGLQLPRRGTTGGKGSGRRPLPARKKRAWVALCVWRCGSPSPSQPSAVCYITLPQRGGEFAPPWACFGLHRSATASGASALPPNSIALFVQMAAIARLAGCVFHHAVATTPFVNSLLISENPALKISSFCVSTVSMLAFVTDRLGFFSRRRRRGQLTAAGPKVFLMAFLISVTSMLSSLFMTRKHINMAGKYHLKWGGHLKQRTFHQQPSYHNPYTYCMVNRAVAVPVSAPVLGNNEETNDDERQQMCENYGFTQIGEPLPDNVTMRAIMETLPKKVFEIDDMKAWKSVLISVTSYALGIFMISKSPWYLLPLAWAWTGTAVTGFFVIGHDCAHKSFSRSKLVEDIVGTLAFLPLIYPYEPWRFKHDQHHAKTNMLLEDTAWHPVRREEFDSSPHLRKGIILGYGPFRPWMSIAHWLMWHFDLKKFRPNEVLRAKISLACVFGFIAIGWPLIIYKTGFIGWIKYWFMPWLGYHFWMSTFTMVHHTAPHIPFKSSDEWNAAQAQLSGTVHCNYPRWIEILCHDINVHIPHHISPRIPSYNLQAAHQSLKENWGKYLNEANWNWRLMKTILTVCHIYNKEKNYVAFDEIRPEESGPILFLKKMMPDYA